MSLKSESVIGNFESHLAHRKRHAARGRRNARSHRVNKKLWSRMMRRNQWEPKRKSGWEH